MAAVDRDSELAVLTVEDLGAVAAVQAGFPNHAGRVGPVEVAAVDRYPQRTGTQSLTTCEGLLPSRPASQITPLPLSVQ